MISNIAVFGSCVSRDIFYSEINPYYKKFFNVVLDSQRQSLISLMQEPFYFNFEDIIISPKNKINISRTRFIKEDLNKNFLNNLSEDIDILIFDNYFESRFGVLQIGNNYITNNDWDLPDTKFYNDITNKKSINMNNNEKLYFALWKIYCDIFFDYLRENFPNLIVILNSTRLCYSYKKDGSILQNNQFKPIALTSNFHLKLFDDYIKNKKNVFVLNFDKNTLLDENHIWGPGPVHFYKKFYEDRLNQIIQIKLLFE